MNLADLAYAQHKATEEKEIQARVVIARDMYEGDIDKELLSQLDEALPGSTKKLTALFNAYATVIEEILNRLHIKQWVDAPEDGQPVEWANKVWQDINMDEIQYDLFEYTLVDGEAFVILAPEFDPMLSAPVLKPFVHRRWTSAEVGGDNEGCKAHYKNGRLAAISKRWIETYYTEKDEKKTRQRLTLYIAADGKEITVNRIEKYEIVSGSLVEFKDEEGNSAFDWPYAFACIHFQNVGRRMQGQRAQGPQVLLDNAVADLLAAAGLQAAPMLIALGMYPTTDGKAPKDDGSNVWKTGPGRIIGHPEKGPNEAEVKHVPPGDLSQLLDAIDKVVVMLALTTGTTSLIANLIAGSQISAEFLKQTDIRPTAATRQRQAAFGNAMSRMMKTYATLSKQLSLGNVGGDAEQPLHAEWLAADIRGNQPGDGDEAAEAQQQAQATETEPADDAGAMTANE